MSVYVHARMCACLNCDALLWVSSQHFYNFYSCLLEASDNKIYSGRFNIFMFVYMSAYVHAHVFMLEL